MKIHQIILAAVVVLLASTCYGEMTWTVVDAETGEPIEGAVVLVEWTITKGFPGMTNTESYEVKEALTDKEGKVRISDVSKLFAQPHVTVYKKGYVAWNNQFIFPDYKKRTDFKWQNNLLIKLQTFKKEYSYIDHQAFIDGAAHVGLSPSKKQLFLKIYNEGERESVIKERQKSMN